MSGTVPAIRHTLTVPLSVGRAFAAFVEGLGAWWPGEYTWSADVLELIAIEPRVGGRCFERGPHDFECDWGRVLVYERPYRIVFTWQISPDRQPVPDPARAGEIDVQFEEEEPSVTEVHFEHRGFERHGPEGAAYRDALAAAEGWPYILERYAAYAAKQVPGVS